MIPKYPDFKSLKYEDRAEIEHFFKSYSPQICELSVITLFTWRKIDKPQLTIINNNLCVLLDPPHEPPFFLEPLGSKRIEETVSTCLEHAGVISRASNRLMSKLSLDQYQVIPLRDQFDYVYTQHSLAELKGRKFDGKRNQIRNFKKKHPGYHYVPLDKDMRGKAHELYNAWSLSRRRSPGEAGRLPTLAYNVQRGALQESLEHFDEFNLMGGGLVEDEKLLAFVVGHRLNKTTACVQFMYAHPKAGSANQMVLREACRKTFYSFEFINLEQDLGLKGLRRMKLSYKPVKMEEKYEIRRG
jgi:hypothetical protein